MNTDSKFYSVRQVAEILGVQKLTVRSEILRGRLKAMKVARDYRIEDTELQDYIKRNEVQTGGDSSGSDLS